MEFSGLVKIALAQIEDPPISITLTNPLGCPDFLCVFTRIANALFNISVPIVSVMVLVGAFQIMFSTGDPEKLRTGKKTIIYAAVGFAVVLMANGVAAIIQNILKK